GDLNAVRQLSKTCVYTVALSHWRQSLPESVPSLQAGNQSGQGLCLNLVPFDTGPLVALVNRREQFHKWVTNQFGQIEPPLLTCEAVVTEACFLLQNVYGGEAAVISFVQKRIIHLPFRLSEEAAAVDELMQRYQSVPMSLADACSLRALVQAFVEKQGIGDVCALLKQ
ncbi:type II toxin-antitoxin system VapC family toxin, partial [Nostoc sp. PCC 9305]|uniref:type II toxin-antitoxin system VapC family toxin n=1 Tax=Nostoc sp. PCC 9305 TaxID=296636 RepID=UPI0039C5C023